MLIKRKFEGTLNAALDIVKAFSDYTDIGSSIGIFVGVGILPGIFSPNREDF
jgi:hypothetical protein